MTKVKVNLFTCPVCMAVIDNLEVDLEATEKIFLESGKPVPIVTSCPNGHPLIAYVYIHAEGGNKKVLIRQVKSAIAAGSVETSNKESQKKEKGKDTISRAKNWLEDL